MGELESIKDLPGMIDAAVDTLHKALRAGSIWPCARPSAPCRHRAPGSGGHRAASGCAMRPVDIVATATPHQSCHRRPWPHGDRRPYRAFAVLAAASLQALTAYIPVRWAAGPECSRMARRHRRRDRAHTGASAEVGAVSAATAYHEAIEAMRWARHLLASGVSTSKIAIAIRSPQTMTIISWPCAPTRNIDLHFVHGVRTVTTREDSGGCAG
jgi:hypothetical protein